MEIANKSQAENGTNNDTIMTPLRVKQSIQANGSSGGTTDYTQLTNKPKINNVELDGNKTSANLGLQSTLVSGTNIKTVNNTSLLGSGNVAVQPTLVSGTNIKTINNTSLLGSGNITISGGGNTYYFDGQNNQQNVAMLNTICAAYDNGEEINFTGKFADYETGQTFQAPINVTKYTDADFNETYSFVSDPVAWLDDSTTPEELYYLTFALALTGTWGNFTAVSTYRLDTIPVEQFAKLTDVPTKTSDLTNDGDGTTVVNTHSTTPSPVSMVFPITNVSGSGLWQQAIFGDKTRFQPIFNGTLQTNEYIAYESDVATKQDTLVSGTNIKTINSTSLLGSGDISVVTSETDPVFSASAASSITSSDITNWNAAEANVQSDWSQSDNTKDDFIKNKPNIPTKTSDLQNDSGFLTTETDPVFSASAAGAITSSDVTAWNGKQDELVSGTNIKTINNTSLLGSGNIDIQGSVPANVAYKNIDNNFSTGQTINGDLTAEGKIETTKSIRIPKNWNQGYGLCNSDGTSIIRDWNNTHVTLDATGGTLYLGYQNTTGINILDGKATIDSNGVYNGTARNSNRVNSNSKVGSDVSQSQGWYKVCGGGMSGYGNHSMTWFVSENYTIGYYGIYQLNVRGNNGSLAIWNAEWLVRKGFSADDIRVVVSGTSWTLYIKRSVGQYGRISFTPIATNDINGNEYVPTYYNSTTKESTTPTATKTSTDYNEVVLYDYSGGTTGNVTLSETSANFSSLEVCARIIVDGSPVEYFTQKIYAPNGKNIALNCTYDNGTYLYLYDEKASISGTTITRGTKTRWRVSASTAAQTRTVDSGCISITKVVGYRW